MAEVLQPVPSLLVGNSLLIMLQDPQATHVAGYQAFRAMGRQVRRGESGIKVLAPIILRDPRLDDAGHPVRDDQGRVLHRTHVVATKPVTVFDIRQTEGPPLPDPKIGEATLLTGQAPFGLWDRLQGLLEERGFDVRRGADLGGPNGYTDFGRRLVMVRDDVDDAQAVKTLAHEAGHVILHPDQQGRDCRGIIEVEAESVAYMVTSAHGLDSGQYTFNYVAGWAGAGPLSGPLTVTTAMDDLCSPGPCDNVASSTRRLPSDLKRNGARASWLLRAVGVGPAGHHGAHDKVTQWLRPIKTPCQGAVIAG